MSAMFFFAYLKRLQSLVDYMLVCLFLSKYAGREVHILSVPLLLKSKSTSVDRVYSKESQMSSMRSKGTVLRTTHAATSLP